MAGSQESEDQCAGQDHIPAGLRGAGAGAGAGRALRMLSAEDPVLLPGEHPPIYPGRRESPLLHSPRAAAKSRNWEFFGPAPPPAAGPTPG